VRPDKSRALMGYKMGYMKSVVGRFHASLFVR
jgi:hypothetical protein